MGKSVVDLARGLVFVGLVGCAVATPPTHSGPLATATPPAATPSQAPTSTMQTPTPAAPTPTQMPSPSTAPASTPAETPSPSPGVAFTINWQPAEVQLPSGWAARSLGGLLTAEGELYAVGSLEGGDPVHIRSTAWHSDDGLHWQMTDVPGSWDNLSIRSLIDSGLGHLSVGTRISGEVDVASDSFEPTDWAGTIWQASDLVGWELIAELPVGSDPRTILSIGDFLVIGGGWEPNVGQTCFDVCAPGAGIWWSADGAAWTPAITLADPDVRFGGLAATAGRAVAFATRAGHEFEGPLVWLTDNGRDWEEVSPTGLDGVYLGAIAAGPATGFVAAGVGAFQHGAIFASPDGRAWTRTTDDGPGLTGLAPVPGFGYVGWSNSLELDYGQWLSPDGVHWSNTVGPVPEVLIIDGTNALAAGASFEAMTVCDDAGDDCVYSPIWRGSIER